MAPGCVRGAENKTYTVVPAWMKARTTTGEATTRWRDISIYRAGEPRRLAGPTYEVSSYGTKAECEAAKQAAVAKVAESRTGRRPNRCRTASRGGIRIACTTRPFATSADLLARPTALPVDAELLPSTRRTTGGSAEDDSDAMGLPVIDEPDAEITGQGDAIDFH